MKTWILYSETADYGDIRHAVVRAADPASARALLRHTVERKTETGGRVDGYMGTLSEPYGAIEVTGDDEAVILTAGQDG